MKKLLYFAAIAALFGGLFSACEDKTEDYGSPLALDKESIAATAAAASFEVAVTAKGAWVAESDAAWATVSPASGRGDGKVTINVANASDSLERTATISVSLGYVHKEVVVTQAAQTNTALSLDTDAIGISYAAISYPIVVTSDGDWSVSADSNWVTVSPASGTGSGTFKIDVAQNNGAARTAKVTVSGSGLTKQVAVSQGAFGVSFAISRAVTDSILAEPLELGTVYNIQVTGNDEWTITSDQAWCVVSPVNSGEGNQQVTVAIDDNFGASERYATLTFTGLNSGLSYAIPVKQKLLFMPARQGSWLFDDPADLLKPEAGTSATLAYAKGGNANNWPTAFDCPTSDLTGFSVVPSPTGLLSASDGAIRVQKGYSLQCTHNIPIPNGLSSTKISEYTILWRVKYPSGSNNYKALLQTDITNGNGANYGGLTSHNDAEWFITGTDFRGGVGVGTEAGGHQNRIQPDVWHNLLLVINLGVPDQSVGPGSVRFYLNGNFISMSSYNDPNARAALESTFLFFADEDNDGGESAVWDVAELAIWDVALDAAQAKAVQVEIDAKYP